MRPGSGRTENCHFSPTRFAVAERTRARPSARGGPGRRVGRARRHPALTQRGLGNAPPNTASPFRQAMRSATSGGRSASQPRDQAACSGT